MPMAVLSISPSPLEHCLVDVADLVLSHRTQSYLCRSFLFHLIYVTLSFFIPALFSFSAPMIVTLY
jgi:hypothetical protein